MATPNKTSTKTPLPPVREERKPAEWDKRVTNEREYYARGRAIMAVCGIELKCTLWENTTPDGEPISWTALTNMSGGQVTRAFLADALSDAIILSGDASWGARQAMNGSNRAVAARAGH